jgi:hypothetical protein
LSAVPHIELDPHVTGTCVLTINENSSSRASHEALGDWLG